MKLLDTTDTAWGRSDDVTTVQWVNRERKALLSDMALGPRSENLGRIQRLISMDPSIIPDVLEYFSGFRSLDPKIRLQVYSIYVNCVERILAKLAEVDAELFIEALESIKRQNTPGGKRLLERGEEFLLANLPYHFGAHRFSIGRKTVQGVLSPIEEKITGARAPSALRRLEGSQDDLLLVGHNIVFDACSVRDDLPPELVRLAALKEVQGQLDDALKLMNMLLNTMYGVSMSQFCDYLAHYKRLLEKATVEQKLVQEHGMGYYKLQIRTVDRIMAEVTRDWDETYTGTQKMETCLRRVKHSDEAGGPLLDSKNMEAELERFRKKSRAIFN